MVRDELVGFLRMTHALLIAVAAHIFQSCHVASPCIYVSFCLTFFFSLFSQLSKLHAQLGNNEIQACRRQCQTNGMSVCVCCLYHSLSSFSHLHFMFSLSLSLSFFRFLSLCFTMYLCLVLPYFLFLERYSLEMSRTLNSLNPGSLHINLIL